MATSGLLMFAKHRDAEVAVSKMFQARTVKNIMWHCYKDKFKLKVV
jgi:23S rRNA-/tRNA-specific pseudouridylate synthase